MYYKTTDFVEKQNIDFLLISLGTVIDFLGSEKAEEFLAKFPLYGERI